ncbi:thiamine phosphate synthase [Marinomonas flavescens]|uniref:thiamine phosphate synthase n=1 Tax=Marinomonas flavescens TaxID=2529379 RepID=UPI0010548992|nr:thiamine phosphate synthase [Marinomonas flavescens]
MNKLPVIWQVGARQSCSDSFALSVSIAEHLPCVMKYIDSYQQAGASTYPCSFVEFDDQWQTLLDQSMPDVIYLHALPSNELVVCCAKWLQHIKALLPSVVVVLNADLGSNVNCQRFLSELLACTDVVLAPKRQLDCLIDCHDTTSVADVHTALVPWFAVSDAVWLLTDEQDSSVWYVTKQKMYDFSFACDSVALTQAQSYRRAFSMACFLGHGYDELDATTMAQTYLASDLDGHAGWPNQTQYLPTVTELSDGQAGAVESKTTASRLTFATIDKQKFGLYPVVDSLAWLELVLENGATTAQLRIKDPSTSTLDSQIKSAVALGQRYQAQVFINDYWQKAIEHGAFGIHLGQEDLEVADLAAISQAGLALGISTHGYFEIANAMKINPSYIALGHIFPTQTKDMPSQPQGLTRLALYAALLKGVYPTVAIGGISAERVAPVLKTGVDSVALVTAITKALNPEQATRDLLSVYQTEKALLDE